jgi:membrane-associated phospholipid phosphatase
MRRILFGVLLINLALPLPAAAQDRSVGSDLKNIGRDFWFILSSPGHASGRDLKTAGLAAAGSGIALMLDEPIHDWMHTDPLIAKALGPFGESSPVSIMGRTWFFLLPLSIGMYGAGHAFGSDNLRDAGLGCATSNLATTLTRASTSLLVGRLRPGVHRGAFEFELFAFGDWNQRSFPGGHASNIMSCASYFNRRFDLGIAGPAIYGLAGGVGLARIVDEAHWTSDTVTGMAYGYAVGRNIADRFLDRQRRRQNGLSLPSLHVGLKFTF